LPLAGTMPQRSARSVPADVEPERPREPEDCRPAGFRLSGPPTPALGVAGGTRAATEGRSRSAECSSALLMQPVHQSDRPGHPFRMRTLCALNAHHMHMSRRAPGGPRMNTFVSRFALLLLIGEPFVTCHCARHTQALRAWLPSPQSGAPPRRCVASIAAGERGESLPPALKGVDNSASCPPHGLPPSAFEGLPGRRLTQSSIAQATLEGGRERAGKPHPRPLVRPRGAARLRYAVGRSVATRAIRRARTP
jgi:hypothetical protein